MKRRVFLAESGRAVFGASVLPLAPKSEGTRASTPSKGRTRWETQIAALEKRVPEAMRELLVPGVSVALLREGRVGWMKSFGVASAQSQAPVTRETVFEAASISKPVFAYRVLKLCELGVLDLDRSLESYLPEPYLPAEPRVKQITARMVLCHTTGFPNWRPEGQPLVLERDPGTRFGYSGEGYVYLQKVVEHLTREPIAAQMRSHLLDPFRMRRSSYLWLSEYEGSFAQGHTAQGEPVPKRKPESANVASSLHTTAYEIGLFMSRILKPPRPDAVHVRPSSIQQMLTVQEKTGSKPWGLGWGLDGQGAKRSFWHWGNNGEFKCFAVAYPESGSGVVVMTNGTHGLRLCRSILPTVIGDEHGVFDSGLLDG
jgi:CubicO group peptidase (beta-lactamase class C family)